MEVYLEFIVVGQQVKVVAIDSDSGVEVSIIAPTKADRNHVKNIAINKLKRRLALDKNNKKPLDQSNEKVGFR